MSEHELSNRLWSEEQSDELSKNMQQSCRLVAPISFGEICLLPKCVTKTHLFSELHKKVTLAFDQNVILSL